MQFFESNIRPVLADNCFKCHGPAKQRGGLRLDTRGDALTGGDNGKAVVPGDVENSLLLQAVTHSNPDLKPMPPPPAKLSPKQIADLTQWVKMGPWPGQEKTVASASTIRRGKFQISDRDRAHWAFQSVKRPARYEVKTTPRQRPDNVKEAVVVARAFENQRLRSEEVAEFNYRPTACRKSYRMVVVRKNISVEKGEQLLFDRVVYFFYISNDRESTPAEIVFSANDRCHQENLHAQLKGGVRALYAPVDDLVSNGAWMVMTSLAWNLKAWLALSLAEAIGLCRRARPGCEAHRVADGV